MFRNPQQNVRDPILDHIQDPINDASSGASRFLSTGDSSIACQVSVVLLRDPVRNVYTRDTVKESARM